MENKPAQPAPPPRPSWHTLAVGLFLLVLTLAAYQGVRLNDFIYFDDPDYITNNPNVKQGLTWATVKWAFTTTDVSNYHPLTWLSHAADYAWFGANPSGHHLVSLAIHLANVLLLFAAMRQLTGTFWRSAAVAAVFALHPLHVESVAWVCERKDVLSGLFFLLCVMAYAKYARLRDANRPAGLAYTLALLAFAAGLLAKPMLVTLPCVLLLLDFWPLRRFDFLRRTEWAARVLPCLKEKIPFFLLTIASSIATFVAQREGGAVVGLQALAPSQRLLNAALGYVGYLQKSFWPANLSVFYPTPTEMPVGTALLALLLCAGITLLVLWRARQAPWWTTGWLWFVGMLVPVIGLVQVGGQAMADRYTYLPLIGLSIGAVWWVAAWVAGSPGRRVAIACLGGAALAAGSYATHRRVADWRNSETLFKQALDLDSRNIAAHANLGVYYFDHGDYRTAETHLRQSLTICPTYAPSWNALGQVLLKLDRYEEAIDAYAKAAAYGPKDPAAPLNLGLALIHKKDYESAQAALQESLRREPGSVSAQLGLALVQLARGLTNEARNAIAQVTTGPTTPVASLDLLAQLHEQFGNAAEAARCLNQAVQAQPASASLHQRLGQLFAADGRTAEARQAFEKAVGLAPRDPTARTQLATVLLEQGSTREALAEYRAALNLQTNLLAALNNLAWTLATHPDSNVRNGVEAVAFGQRACALTEWKVPYVIGTLAAAYAENNQWKEAVETALKAHAAATKAGETELARRNGELAEQYRKHQPYREGPSKP